MRIPFATTLAALLLATACVASAAAPPPVVALRGATLVDLADFGRSSHDIRDSVVLLQGDRILAAGTASDVTIPAGATVVDASGKYLVPGLIDGFSSQNNENQARALLYMGVTTIFAIMGDSRRGETIWSEVGPTVRETTMALGYDMHGVDAAETVGDIRAQGKALTPAQMESYMDVQRWDAINAVLLYYSMSPPQVAAAAQRAREQSLITIGELGHTGVLEGARMGVSIFVHLNRYMLDLAPPAIRNAVADDPFGPARSAYMDYLGKLDPASPALRDYAIALAAEPVAMMPTLGLIALTLPDHANPWKEPVATLIDSEDVMMPADPVTGDAPVRGNRSRAEEHADALHHLELQRVLVKHGVKFVVGSGSDAFGMLPGAGTHVEMELLVRIGLTPRQALAAATTNYASLFDFIDYGVIRAGAQADLLLLDADPTVDIRHVREIAQLYQLGVPVDRAALLKRVPPRVRD